MFQVIQTRQTDLWCWTSFKNYKPSSSSTGTDWSWVRIFDSPSISSGFPSGELASTSCSGEGLPRSSDSPPGRPNKAGSTGRSPLVRTSNRVKLAEVERGTGLHTGWGIWLFGVTPVYMGLSVSMLSGVRAFCVVGVAVGSSGWGEGIACTWLVWMGVSWAQYGGDELMKFRGDDVARLLGVGVEGCETTGKVEGLRMGITPFVEMVEASGTGFRGKLVSWMPAGMVRISLPCWTLR